MRKQRTVCFVDDDRDEIARFKNSLGARFVVGAGTSPDEALDNLPPKSRRRVDLFVLDMYFPTSGQNTEEQRLRLGEAWDNFRSAERILKKVLSDLGQSFAGGRKLAHDIKSKHIGQVPFVFFTRKGNLLDAVEAYEQVGAISVIKKPDPHDAVPEDEKARRLAYDKAMMDDADSIARDLESAIRRGTLWFRCKDHVIGFAIGVASSVAVWVLTEVAF